MTSKQKTILGIDPGTKEMGMAVTCGPKLLAFGVHSLRNGSKPYDLIGQARRVLLTYLENYAPEEVVIEAPLMIPTRRAAILATIAEELRHRAEELGLKVVEVTPREVRQKLTGNPRASKIDVAAKLVEMGFDKLRPLLPVRPKRSALGYRPKDKYWLHAFDALGLACAVQRKASAPPK